VLEQIAAGLGASWTDLVLIPITAIGVYTTMLLLSRLFGQRQLSRSTTYDLAFVFALGSLVGRVILVRTSLLAAMVGLVTMFTLHLIVGWLHHTVPAFHRVTQNRPVLLVAHGAVIDENLRRARTSRIELYQELRAHGIASLDHVGAAILERDGNISVISADAPPDQEMFDEVVGRELLLGPR
jgi:uncharacterized membrane protein YcaP (DUF421 family)